MPQRLKDIDPIQYKKLVSELAHKQSRIDSLLEITEAVNHNLSVDELFSTYTALLRAQFNYDSILIIYKTDTGWRRYTSEGTIPLANLALLSELKNYSVFSFTNGNASLGNYDVVIPVYHKTEALAFVLIDGIYNHTEGSIEEESRYLQTFTNVTVMAVENKRLFIKRLEQELQRNEMALAAQVQSTLIPSVLPKTNLYEFAAQYIPHKAVGGDLYDVIPHPTEKSLFVCIADVAGKGISAALLMANFHATLRAAITSDFAYHTFAKVLNKEVYKITNGERFISLFVAKFEFDKKRLLYINAGHFPPIYKTENGVELLKNGCPVLGVVEDLPHLKKGETVLMPNSTLFCFTDGLTDLANSTEQSFGMERLMECVVENDTPSPVEFNKKLLDELDGFRGESEYNDDITFLTCRIKEL